MPRKWTCLLALLALALILPVERAPAAEVVSFPSEHLVLHGLLYRPPGAGPIPAVLYNHGSAPGLLNNQAFDAIAPLFVARGWVFFAPYRRGQGLSADAGPYIGAQIAAARKRGGLKAAAAEAVRDLTTDQLADQMAARAWISHQTFVTPDRIVAMGNSFGGIETVLGVARGGYCAAVDASGGAESWELAPQLRVVMLQAVEHAKAPMLFFQARNDYTTAPSRVLYRAMRAAHREAALRIYPPYGRTAAQGHSFAWRGGSIWFTDVYRYIEKYCGP